MLWIWSSPVSTKELFIKITVPKRQIKSLKRNYEVVTFYYICKLHTWNLLYTIFSQAFLNDFAEAFLKDFTDFPLIWNSRKSNNLRSQKLFDIFLIINLPLFFLFNRNFGSAFFKDHLPVVVSTNTCLKVTPKNLK